MRTLREWLLRHNNPEREPSNLKKENLILASLSVLLGRLIAPRFVGTPEFGASIEKLIWQIREVVQENSETAKKKKK